MSATGLGVSGALITSDALHCQQMVDFVDDKRFMSASPRDEISDHVRESVQQVRAYAVNSQHLPGSKSAQGAIKEIARASRDYIATTGQHPDSRVLEVALLALRKRVGISVVALCEKYNLECDLDLDEYRDNALDLLLEWMRAEPYETAAADGDEVNPE